MYIRTDGGLAQTAPAISDRIDPKDKRIDVRAKFALQRMRDKKPAMRIDALRLIRAINGGQLAGIYGDNLAAAVKVARKHGIHRQQLVPKGENAAMVLDPATPLSVPPTVIFRGDTPDISKNPARLDAALQKASQSFELWQSGRLFRCAGAPSRQAITALAAVERPPSAPVPVHNVAPLMYCQMLPSQQQRLVDRILDNIRARRGKPNRLDAAVLEFVRKVDNDELVKNGQHYWRLLVGRAVNGKPKCEQRIDDEKPGKTLFRQLSQHYCRSSHWGGHMRPRTAEEVEQWSRDARRVPLTRCDYDALDHHKVSAEACYNTVDFMVCVLRRVCAFKPRVNTPAKLVPAFPQSFNHEALGASVSKKHKDAPCIVTYRRPLAKKIEVLRNMLDRGYVVRAGVWGLHTSKRCQTEALVEPGHHVLIIGHDGGNRFVYWNTVYDPCEPDYEHRFGILVYRKTKNDKGKEKEAFVRECDGIYQVVSLTAYCTGIRKPGCCQPWTPTSI